MPTLPPAQVSFVGLFTYARLSGRAFSRPRLVICHLLCLWEPRCTVGDQSPPSVSTSPRTFSLLCRGSMSLPARSFLHILSFFKQMPPSTLYMMHVIKPHLIPLVSPPQLLRLRLSLRPGSMRAPTVACPWGGVLRWTWAAAARCGTGWCVASAPRPPSPTQRCAPGVGRASPSAPPRQTWSKPGSRSTTCWPESPISYRYFKKGMETSSITIIMKILRRRRTFYYISYYNI